MAHTEKKDRTALWRIVAVLAALAVWQTVALIVGERLILVSPVAVLERLLTIWQEPGFFASLWFSFSRITLGFLLALLLGTALAVLAWRFRIAEIMLHPYMVTVKTVPVVSFIVLAYLWLSSGAISTFICFLIVLPTVYTGLLSGLQAADPKMTEMAKVFRIPFGRRLRAIYLPHLTPYILSAASLSAGLAWKSGVAAEIIAIPGGSIGEMIHYADLWLMTEDMYAWTVVLVLASVVFEKLFVLLLKKVLGRVTRI